MPQNRQVMIASVPQGPLRVEDFEVQSSAIPRPGEGKVLCKTLAFTIGAGQRAGLQGSASYAGAPKAGVVMGGTGVARVEESNSDAFRPGDLVVGPTGWQEYSLQDPAQLRVIPPGADPALHLGVLGTNGLTAYFGLLEVGQPQPGETVVVSAAAGSVGHIVGQIAKLQKCRVVGVAGSDEKCSALVQDLGFDVAVNYKDPDFRNAFRAATP
ncbi:MAG: zinc-binding dehydrogenase, partial [Tepidiformaceae bacterium]